MKKIVVLIIALCFVLCGCNAYISVDPDPSESVQQTTQDSPDTDPIATEPGTTIDWELPIDVDDSFTEPVTEPSVPEYTSSGVTEPTTNGVSGEQPTDPTEADPTEPTTNGVSGKQPTDPTEVDPTEPTTVPVTTAPQPTSGQFTSGPIELPLIPG